MNPHLSTALELYEPYNVDLQSLIGWHLSHGIVLSSPEVFALCFHSHSDDPKKAVEFHHSDTLFVTMCCGNMLIGLRHFKDDYQYIAFNRDFKGSPRTRLLSMEEFYSKLK